MKKEKNYPEEAERFFEHHCIKVNPQQTALRIDKFLIDRLPHVTRNKIQLAIKNELIYVNQKPIKASYKVRPRDEIQVILSKAFSPTEVVSENIPLAIVYEDESLLVVDKPAGMVVHPAYQNWTGTLLNALAYHMQLHPTMENNENRPGLVHRIDKGTSGLLVIAKTEESTIALAKQFYEHSIERIYYALVWGTPAKEAGTIDVNIGRSPKDRRVMVAFPEGDIGKHAITHYKVIKRFQYVSLVQCQLETGRTHQIRAHMHYIGHPLFNDARYGGDQILQGPRFSKYKAFIENCFKHMPHQALHAQSLGFSHPVTQQLMYFESDLPLNFKTVLEKWERYG